MPENAKKRGRHPDANSKSGQIRELLKTDMSVGDIAKKLGCTPALVYNVKARAAGGGTKKRGPDRPPKAKATATPSGLDGIAGLGLLPTAPHVLARHRDVDVYPLFGANHLSRFHEEVIQAAGSSDWVLALAASSAIEGMCRLAVHATALPTAFDKTTIGEACNYLQGMPCPEKLRDRLISNLAYMGNPSVRKFLDDLVKRQVIRADHRDAWVSVRNKVAQVGSTGPPRPLTTATSSSSSSHC